MDLFLILYFVALIGGAIGFRALGQRSYFWTALTVAAISVLFPLIVWGLDQLPSAPPERGRRAPDPIDFLATMDSFARVIAWFAAALALAGLAAWLFRALLIASGPVFSAARRIGLPVARALTLGLAALWLALYFGESDLPPIVDFLREETPWTSGVLLLSAVGLLALRFAPKRFVETRATLTDLVRGALTAALGVACLIWAVRFAQTSDFVAYNGFVADQALYPTLALVLSLALYTLFAIAPGVARELRSAPLTAAFGMLVVVLVVLTMIFAPLIAPFTANESVGSRFEAPNETFLFGADRLGRDVLSRILYGAQNSVGIALLATGVAFLTGALAGLFAAIRGGWIDQLLGRIADILMSMPSLIFALLMLSIFGSDESIVILVVAAVYTPRVFRLARAVAGDVVVMDYVEAARLRGENSWYLMRREILPNARSPLIAEFGLEFCFVFLLISGLSFLGIGLQPPTPHWGAMVKELRSVLGKTPQPFFAAGAIALLTVSINFVVDWMLYRSSGLKDK